MKAAIMGFGTVGSGVAEVLSNNAAQIAKRAGQPIELKYILDLREFPDSPFADRIIHDFTLIEQDPEIQVVAECMGGVGAALNFVSRCLSAGKSVVTSNKELIATHGCELNRLAAEHNCTLLFEASVGGGIPVLRPLMDDLAGNEITEVYGILNGTTNYILTKMYRENADFDAVLKEAQALGYAEANPAADIEGPDACRKICILADLAFGHNIAPDQVPTRGIVGIESADTAFATAAGMRIKLIGRARRMDDGRICCYVSPHLIPLSRLLANIDDVFNGIVVHGNAVDDVLFYGRGAGKLPTASAVVGDMVDVAQHLQLRKDIRWESGENMVYPVSELPLRYFVRAEGSTLPVGEPVAAVVEGQCAVLTAPMTRAALDAALSGCAVRNIIPVLD